jgi:RNA-directed DNA polymerase
VHPPEAPSGTRDMERSERGAAMMHGMSDPAERLSRAALAQELADAFLESPWRADALAESGAARMGGWPPWLDALVLSVIAVFRTAPLDDRLALMAAIEAFLAEHSAAPPVRRATARPRPVALDRRPTVPARWPVASVDSVEALAGRLELSDGQLAWLADVRGWERRVADERLRNYRYRALPRPGGLPRVIEVPKARLKEIQRWVLREILDQVPAHASAHGFTRGRSAITHAEQHVHQDVVLRLDLRDFFASIAAGRIHGLFSALGYPPKIARVLTGITTNVLPISVWNVIAATTKDRRLVQARFWLGRALATPHLPQGAPTSPALANLVAFRLDRRLAGLAASAGLRYSRYADDLTFSGAMSFRRRLTPFTELVASIVRDEGFAINRDKSMVRPSSARQSVCGIVVNVHPNVARWEYDELRAILHNAANHGAASQNRSGVADFAAHLRGRISWVASLNPSRGEKLRRRFEAVDWDS